MKHTLTLKLVEGDPKVWREKEDSIHGTLEASGCIITDVSYPSNNIKNLTVESDNPVAYTKAVLATACETKKLGLVVECLNGEVVKKTSEDMLEVIKEYKESCQCGFEEAPKLVRAS
jgi:hypothetical protein